MAQENYVEGCSMKRPPLLEGGGSFARCLIEGNLEADLVDVVTTGIPSLTRDDFIKETIRVEYEWRSSRCDVCKIFGHVHDQCPKKVVSPLIVSTSNAVTPTIEKNNDGFQKVGNNNNNKKKGQSKTTNGSQFVGSSVKQNLRYEPKSTGNYSKKGNITTSNSYSALENDEEEDEEHVENVYDESANLFPNSKPGESSTFTVAAGLTLRGGLFTLQRFDTSWWFVLFARGLTLRGGLFTSQRFDTSWWFVYFSRGLTLRGGLFTSQRCDTSWWFVDFARGLTLRGGLFTSQRFDTSWWFVHFARGLKLRGGLFTS
ncbi:zinc knuckle CX2CX4HX4C containing protein [Tanacetum coccineum]